MEKIFLIGCKKEMMENAMKKARTLLRFDRSFIEKVKAEIREEVEAEIRIELENEFNMVIVA